ncbi:hypothetical protein PG989_013411 [Apiospora arundinis]
MSTTTIVESLCSSTTLVASQKNTATTSLVTTPSTTTTPDVSGSSTTSTAKGDTVWERRDIAFLKTQEELEAECQDVVLGQDLTCGATGHPCIIMDLAPNGQHALVTTTHHQGKDPDRFRSFAGTERYSAGRNLLHLEGGRRFRKNQTAWVYAGWVHLVPVGALRPFGDVKLRIEMQSWIDLYGHQCAMTSINSNLFNDAKLIRSPPSSPSSQMASAAASGSSTSTGGAKTSTPKSQQEGGSFTPPSSPATPPGTPRRQKRSPQPSNKGSPKAGKAKPAPSMNYGGYENVAGNFTNNSCQFYQYQETYQLSALYQQQQQQQQMQLQQQQQFQSPDTTTWADMYWQQTQPVCSQYQYQQQVLPAPLFQQVQPAHTFSTRLISVMERAGGF